MIQKIHVINNSPAETIFFFKDIDLTALPDPSIVLLFGPNGIGKSTLIRSIVNSFQIEKLAEKESDDNFSKEFFENELIKNSGLRLEHDKCPHRIYGYSNSTDNCKVRQARSYSEAFDPRYLSSRLDAKHLSEGQSVIYSAFDLLDALKPGKNMFGEEGEHTIVLLDEIDSGMSIDNIDTAMRKIKYALSKRNDLQVFLSFNSPRVLKHFTSVISLYDGAVHEMKTDDDMLLEIRAHKKMFDKARKYSNGRPRVFN